MADKKTSWLLKLKDMVSGPLDKIGDKAGSSTKKVMQLSGKLDHLKDRSSSLSMRLLKMGALAGGVAYAGSRVVDFTNKIQDQQLVTQQLFSDTANGIDRTTTEIQQLTAQGEALSKTFGDDYRSVQSGINTLMENFGITSKQAFDVIKKGYLSGADVQGDFLNQVKEYAPQFKAVGLEASQAISLMSQSVKKGIWSDKGPDLIKEAGLAIREMTDPARDAIEGLGLDSEKMLTAIDSGAMSTFEAIQQITGAMKTADTQAKQAALADIFKAAGEDAGAEFVMSLSNANLELDRMVNYEDDAVSRMMKRLQLTQKIAEKEQEVANKLFPLTAKLQMGFLKAKVIAGDFLSNLLNFAQANPVFTKVATAISLGSAALFTFSTIVQLAYTRMRILRIQMLLFAKSGFAQTIKTATIGVARFGAAMLATAGKSVVAFVSALGSAIVAQTGLNAAMTANPIGAIIVGVTLLIGAIALLVRHWDTVKQAFIDFGNWLWENNPFRVFVDVLERIFPGVTEWFVNIWGSVKKWFLKIGAFIMKYHPLNIFVNMLDSIFPGFKEKITELWDWIKDKFFSLVETITGWWGDIKSFFGFGGEEGQITMEATKNLSVEHPLGGSQAKFDRLLDTLPKGMTKSQMKGFDLDSTDNNTDKTITDQNKSPEVVQGGGIKQLTFNLEMTNHFHDVENDIEEVQHTIRGEIVEAARDAGILLINS